VCPTIAPFDRVQEALKRLGSRPCCPPAPRRPVENLQPSPPAQSPLGYNRADDPSQAEATLVLVRAGRTALEIRARQVIEQHLELHPEQVLPTLPQMPKERLLMPAILNLEYGYRYRRKGANLSAINCFRVEEIEMSEKLSFDGFIAKIHEVFDRLPDYRRFSPNLRYSIKDAALGAFALFFSQSPSFLA
jgi:hypothetical protein